VESRNVRQSSEGRKASAGQQRHGGEGAVGKPKGAVELEGREASAGQQRHGGEGAVGKPKGAAELEGREGKRWAATARRRRGGGKAERCGRAAAAPRLLVRACGCRCAASAGTDAVSRFHAQLKSE